MQTTARTCARMISSRPICTAAANCAAATSSRSSTARAASPAALAPWVTSYLTARPRPRPCKGLGLVKRVEPRAVDFADLVPPDFKTRRQHLVVDGKGIAGERDAADLFDH